MELTKDLIIRFLSNHKLMTIATYGDHPWIASVYYTYDNKCNLFFLSSPSTLHCRQIEKNPKVAIAIADSSQDINKLKNGLQIFGIATRISGGAKIKHALSLWKKSLMVTNAELSYENMIKKIIKGRMYMISPKKIKLFDQKLFPVEDGEEPVLEYPK